MILSLKIIALAFVITWLLSKLYFVIAEKAGIIDNPTARGSHTTPTILGAGIVLIVIALAGLWTPVGWNFVASICLAAVVGFVDDRIQVSTGLRAVLYSVAVLLVIYPNFDFAWWWLIPTFVVYLGFVNATNFMDGINGITIIYSLGCLVSTILVLRNFDYMQYDSFLLLYVGGLLALATFNCRKKALCFLGDTGSVALGVLMGAVVFFLMTRISIAFLGFVLLYGLDSVYTIAKRLKEGKNIFSAHREHLYQLLANEMKWPHLKVAVTYGVVQIVMNLMVWLGVSNEINDIMLLGGCLILFALIYFFVRRKVESLIK